MDYEELSAAIISNWLQFFTAERNQRLELKAENLRFSSFKEKVGLPLEGGRQWAPIVAAVKVSSAGAGGVFSPLPAQGTSGSTS